MPIYRNVNPACDRQAAEKDHKIRDGVLDLMSDFLDIPTLIAIAVAIIVIVRLRSVLGTRTGNERTPTERARSKVTRPARESTDDTVVPLRPGPANAPADLDSERRARKVEAEIERFARGEADVAEGLKAIADTDPAFMPKTFLEGAKAAYEMIVTAYAHGDRKTLKNLLDKEVYEGFDGAIAEREAQNHHVDFTFVGLPRVEISGAEIEKKVAHVTVQFDAEIVSATLDENNELIEGSTEQVVTITDEWTFARPLKSRDPNWKLVATNQID